MDIRKHLEVAIDAARLAGAYALASRRSGSLVVTMKHENDFVTNVDQETERLIIDRIHKAFPSEHFFGEESGPQSYQADGMGRWIIDPIDGTTNFMRGIPNFTISIAWELEPHHPLVGVVYNPTQDELFHAAQGMGAWCNGMPIQVSSVADPARALLVCVPPHRHHEATDSYFATMRKLFGQVSDLRSFGSAALELSYIAAGRLEGYYEQFLGYYDIAAGMAILQEAGGKVDGFPLADTRCDIVATNGLLQEWVMDVVGNH